MSENKTYITISPLDMSIFKIELVSEISLREFWEYVAYKIE